MTTTAASGWGSSHLAASPAGKVRLDAEEHLAVQQTLARYAFALDHGDLAALEAILTEDAVWTAAIAGEGELGPFTGRAAILDVVRASMEAHTEQRRHHLVNVVVRPGDGDRAVVWAYLMLTTNAGGSPALVTTGFSTFTLRRAGGEWRIAELFVGLDTAE